jgi:hypothetical protein
MDEGNQPPSRLYKTISARNFCYGPFALCYLPFRYTFQPSPAFVHPFIIAGLAHIVPAHRDPAPSYGAVILSGKFGRDVGASTGT